MTNAEIPEVRSPPAPLEQAPEDSVAEKRDLTHAHLITIEKLIIHKYSVHAALLNKADKVARQIINDELREGEYLQVVRPGRYRLYFPNLRDDAGELRCSLITDKLHRAIRDLNPAAQQLNNLDDGPLSPSKPKPQVKTESEVEKSQATVVKPRPTAVRSQTARDTEMIKQSSAAIMSMTGSGTLSRDELLNSPLGRELSVRITLDLSPIWSAAQRMIIGHDCIPLHNGVSLRNIGERFRETGGNPVEITAIIDAVTYERAASVLRKNQGTRTMGLVICPVHISTLANAKYVGAFIAAAQGLPPELQRYLVFLVKGFATPVSRIKVRDVVGYIRPRARTLFVDLPLDVEEVDVSFKEFGFHGARTTVVDFVGEESDLLTRFNHFAERCEQAKLRSTIDGLDSQSMTVGAVSAGFSYLSGSAIERQAGEGAKLQDFDIDELFA